MTSPLPARISDDGRTATWNPALTRSQRVRVSVRLACGGMEERPSMNSGRVRVRGGERVVAVTPEQE